MRQRRLGGPRTGTRTTTSDNDLEDLFYDANGVLHVVNEDDDTFALDQKEGVVVGLRLVREVALVAGTKVEEMEVAGERAFRVRLLSK